VTAGLLVVLVVPAVAIVLTRSERARHLVMVATLGHVGLGVLGLFLPSALGADGQGQVAGLAIVVYGWAAGSAIFTAACTGIIFRRVFRGRKEMELESDTLRTSRVGFVIAALVDVATVAFAVVNTFVPVVQVGS
jgi:hypothetical protein